VRAEIAESATLRFAAVEIEARSRGANSYFGLRVPAPATPEEPRPRPRAARPRERLGRAPGGDRRDGRQAGPVRGRETHAPGRAGAEARCGAGTRAPRGPGTPIRPPAPRPRACLTIPVCRATPCTPSHRTGPGPRYVQYRDPGPARREHAPDTARPPFGR